MTGEELWRLWLDQFDDELVALAEAMWAANRMVKGESPQTRDRFYALKDEFVLRYAVSGKKVRDETPPRTYKGSWGVIRTLYCHKIEVGDLIYRLHSYVLPLETEPGLGGEEDQTPYGGFSLERWSWLPYSFTELYKMLSYYAANSWNFKVNDQVW